MITLYILPLGKIRKEKLRHLGKIISERLSVSVRVLDPIPIFPNTHNKKRQQYEAGAILRELSLIDFGKVDRILAVTDVDIYAEDLSFVFGSAEAPGCNALMSLKRLENVYYHQPDNGEVLFERALKEALHELGHTFGLSHCPDKCCVMYYSQTIDNVDEKGDMFCSRCWNMYKMYQS